MRKESSDTLILKSNHNYLCKDKMPRHLYPCNLNSYICITYMNTAKQLLSLVDFLVAMVIHARETKTTTKALTVTVANACYVLTMARYHACIISFKPHHGPIRLVLFLFCFCRTGN